MIYTDNPLADYERYEDERNRNDEKYPHCDECGETIYDHYYRIEDDIVCKECLDIIFRCEVEI